MKKLLQIVIVTLKLQMEYGMRYYFGGWVRGIKYHLADITDELCTITRHLISNDLMCIA